MSRTYWMDPYLIKHLQLFFLHRMVFIATKLEGKARLIFATNACLVLQVKKNIQKFYVTITFIADEKIRGGQIQGSWIKFHWEIVLRADLNVKIILDLLSLCGKKVQFWEVFCNYSQYVKYLIPAKRKNSLGDSLAMPAED